MELNGGPMRAVIQRVSNASVSVDGQIIGAIEGGLVVLLGIRDTDEPADADYLAEKIVHLRIFNDEEGKMNRSLLEVNGSVLAISQFTLYANTRKGRRPSFIEAASPERAEPLYEYFIKQLRQRGVHVEKGQFGAAMLVKIYNEGPVTIIIDSEERLTPRRKS